MHTIKQITGSDCFLACIAMALGKAHVLDVFTKEDIDKVVADKGVGDATPWFDKVGLTKHVDWKRVYLHGTTDHTMDQIKILLWKRRAILSVKSLNIDGGMHALYWDGEALHDPSTLRTYQHLSTVFITELTIFKD